MTERFGSSFRDRFRSRANAGVEGDDHEVVRVDSPTGRGGYVVSESPTMVLVPSRTYVTVEVTGRFRTELAELRRVAELVAVTSGIAGLSYDDLPLEGFWESDDDIAFDPTRLRAWRWRAAIRLLGDPANRIVHDLIRGQVAHAAALSMLTVPEGRAVQALHRGPYDTIGITIDKIRWILDRQHLDATGNHHEIYLTDPAVTPPAESRTVIRQAVRRALSDRPPSVFDDQPHPAPPR